MANGRAKCTPVRPAEQLRWPTPVYLGGPTIDLLHRLPDRLPELGLAEIHGASVFGSHGWVVVDDSLLEGQSWFGSALQAEVGLPNDGLDRVPLPGVTLSLLSEWADVNYGHLLYDAVPRLDLFERSGYPIEKVDTILCAAPEHLVPLWRELGLDPVKTVQADPKVIYDADVLLSPSFPGVRRTIPSWAAAFLRQRLWRSPERTRRRLYVRRSTSRLVANEFDLWPVLEANGFEQLDPSGAESDARAAFAGADIVVGAHGAALADIVFCPSGAFVLEMVPTDHVYPHWFAASVASGLNHRCIAGESDDRRPTGTLGPSPHDFRIDLQQFTAAVEQLIRATQDN